MPQANRAAPRLRLRRTRGACALRLQLADGLATWAPHSRLTAQQLRERFSFDEPFRQHETGRLDNDGYFAHLRHLLELDCELAQVEAGSYALSPWLLDYEHDRTIGKRMGNRSPRAVPHGAFACEGEDRWIAIACWTDDEWARLTGFLGFDDPSLATLEARLERVDEVEAAVEAWTATRTREEIADLLQAAGIEAVPVYDFGDVHEDPQIEHREHFVPLTHPYWATDYEHRHGSVTPTATTGRARLGQDNDWVLGELLGVPADERSASGRQRSIGSSVEAADRAGRGLPAPSETLLNLLGAPIVLELGCDGSVAQVAITWSNFVTSGSSPSPTRLPSSGMFWTQSHLVTGCTVNSSEILAALELLLHFLRPVRALLGAVPLTRLRGGLDDLEPSSSHPPLRDERADPVSSIAAAPSQARCRWRPVVRRGTAR